MPSKARRRLCLVAPIVLAWTGAAMAQGAVPTAPTFTSLPELGPLVRKARPPDRVVPGKPIPQQKIARPAARAPIPFVPFTLDDLKAVTKNPNLTAGSEIDVPARKLVKRLPGVPDTVLKPAQRTRMKASEILARANELEQQLNREGRSLRNRATTVVASTSPQKPVLDARRAVSLQKIRVPAANVRFAPVRLAEMKEVQAVQQQRSQAIAQKAAAAASTGTQANLAPTERTWGESFGDPDVVSVELAAKLGYQGTPSQVKAWASASALAYLFGIRQDFVVLSADATGANGAAGSRHAANLSMKVLGMDLVPPIHLAQATAIEAENAAEFSVNPKTEIRFQLGPVPMSATFGALGTVGFRYSLAASPLYVRAIAEPQTSLDAYVEIAVDAYVAEAGAGGQLTLLDENLELSAVLMIDDSSGTPRYTWSYGGYNTLGMLSGSVYVFARVDYVVGSEEWRWNIFEWDGFRVAGYLFQETSSQDFNGQKGPVLLLPKGNYAATCSGCTRNDTSMTCATCDRLDRTKVANAALRLPCAGWVTNRDGALHCLPDGDYLAHVDENGKFVIGCLNCYLEPPNGGSLKCQACPDLAMRSMVTNPLGKPAALSAPCGVARLGRYPTGSPNGTLECAAPPPPRTVTCAAGLKCCPVSMAAPNICSRCIPAGESCWPNLALRVGPAAVSSFVTPASAQRPPTQVKAPAPVPSRIPAATTR